MRKDHENQMIQGTFIGLMLIMISYYILMAIGARSFEYFCLSWYWTALLMFKLVMNGLAFEYLWPESVSWANQASGLSVPFVFLAASFATTQFLPIRNFPRLQKVFYFFMSALGACCIGSFFLPYFCTRWRLKLQCLLRTVCSHKNNDNTRRKEETMKKE